MLQHPVERILIYDIQRHNQNPSSYNRHTHIGRILLECPATRERMSTETIMSESTKRDFLLDSNLQLLGSLMYCRERSREKGDPDDGTVPHIKTFLHDDVHSEDLKEFRTALNKLFNEEPTFKHLTPAVVYELLAHIYTEFKFELQNLELEHDNQSCLPHAAVKRLINSFAGRLTPFDSPKSAKGELTPQLLEDWREHIENEPVMLTELRRLGSLYHEIYDPIPIMHDTNHRMEGIAKQYEDTEFDRPLPKADETRIRLDNIIARLERGRDFAEWREAKPEHVKLLREIANELIDLAYQPEGVKADPTDMAKVLMDAITESFTIGNTVEEIRNTYILDDECIVQRVLEMTSSSPDTQIHGGTIDLPYGKPTSERYRIHNGGTPQAQR